MVFVQHYDSPLGPITLACDETAIIGLWFDGQNVFWKYPAGTTC